uniref:Uncharacterized protein n=1 Tax=Hirondellea gigas TaxID=1518452 RepID=A0A6A7G6G3_9CRUS
MQSFTTAISSKISNLWVEEKFTSLSDEAKDAIGLIDEIRALGAELYVELPTIVFIGKQSSGKSSLVEALTKITLPRQDGTCTRCVTDVRTKTAKAFSCSVTLRWHRKNEIRVEPFEELSEIALVEDSVRRAQIILLNPRHHFDQSKKDSDLMENDREHELKFTRDAVCVEIRGPDIGNVSLVDLPGLIQYTEREQDRRYIKLVESLVVDYIQKPHSIIVSIISCKDDIENQVVKALASRYDKEGLRTVGVLTKPDVIESGCYEKWLNILTGKRHGLRLGWFIVKNPSKLELAAKPSFEESRREEQRYFSQTYPWNEVDPALQQRIGCPSLLRALGKLLQHTIVEQLPKIRNIVSQKLDRSSSKLQAMPVALKVDMVKMTLHDLIDKFAENLRRVVDSEVSAVEEKPRMFWHSVVSEMNQFRDALSKTQPQFSLLQGRDRYQNEECKDSGRIRSLDEVQRTLIPATLGRNLPVTGYGAVTSLLQEFTGKWEAPAVKFVQQVASKLQRMTADMVHTKFSEYPNIHQIIGAELQKEIIRLERQTLSRVRHIVALEQTPATIHTEELAEHAEYYLQKLRSALYPDETAVMTNEQLQKLVAQCSTTHNLTDVGDLVSKLSRIRGNIARKRGALEEQALQVIADSCAYWKIAYFRFSDYIPKEVDHLLLCRFSDRCRSVLMEKLDVLKGKPEDLMKLLEADASLARVRDELTEEVECLRKISHKLNQFV